MIFLILYDRPTGELKHLRSYDDLERGSAEADRLAQELALDNAGTEIVLLEASSLEELQRTHRRYFATASELAKTAADEATTASTKP